MAKSSKALRRGYMYGHLLIALWVVGRISTLTSRSGLYEPSWLYGADVLYRRGGYPFELRLYQCDARVNFVYISVTAIYISVGSFV